MKMLMQAIRDKIFVKVLKQEMLTKGGLVIPETVKKEPQKYGIVISLGPDVKGIQISDTLMFHDRGGQTVIIDDEEYRVLIDNEVYGVVPSK
jgi:chaperonin GroES